MTVSVSVPEGVIVHPLVLLSVVDHYNRAAKNTKKRVLGVLLGQQVDNKVNVANSYAVPFEEDDKGSSVWFLDHTFHEAILAKEKMVGWYHSGPKLRSSDLEINELFKRYNPNPVLVIINVQPTDLSIPTDAYFAVEEVHDDGTATTKTFNHIPSYIGAEESEEIGVEHLLRDIKDTSIGTLSTQITEQVHSLKGLYVNLVDIKNYLEKVVSGSLPMNHQILYNLQNMFNMLPNLKGEATIKSFAVNTNDQLLVIYLSSLVRAVVALHSLIDNKHMLHDHEKTLEEADKKPVASIESADKDAKPMDTK